MNKKYISEDMIVAAFQNWLQECSCEDLARVTGELFGGKCQWVGHDGHKHDEYEFIPDEDLGYYGAFD